MTRMVPPEPSGLSRATAASVSVSASAWPPRFVQTVTPPHFLSKAIRKRQLVPEAQFANDFRVVGRRNRLSGFYSLRVSYAPVAAGSRNH